MTALETGRRSAAADADLGSGAVGPTDDRDEEIDVKTMTCRQLGGPCDLALRGESADDVIKAQDRHLREAVRAGDATHRAAHEEMKGRWRHPVRAMGWYRDTKRAFAELTGT